MLKIDMKRLQEDIERANKFLKHYEDLYYQYWNNPLDEDTIELAKCSEAEYVGKHFLSISSEAFELIRYKVASNARKAL